MFVWAKSFKIKCKHRSLLMLKFIYLSKKNQNVSASSDRHHQLIKIFINWWKYENAWNIVCVIEQHYVSVSFTRLWSRLVWPQTYSHTVMCKVCLTASKAVFGGDAFVRVNYWILSNIWRVRFLVESPH